MQNQLANNKQILNIHIHTLASKHQAKFKLKQTYRENNQRKSMLYNQRQKERLLPLWGK